MLQKILEWLKLPETKNIENLDHPSTTELHKKIIEQKPFLKKLYLDFYNQFKKSFYLNPQGTFVELGSGGGFVKKVIPQIMTSDILPLHNTDLCFSAEHIPFKDSSIDAFFMLDVFHHFKHPVPILKEISRCLKPGGKIVMLEPANTLWGRFIYQNFHHENFDPSGGWEIKGDGPLSSANGALPWIIFCRDKEKLEAQFESLKISKIKYHTPFRYLLSGGVSMKQLVPSFSYPLIKAIELILSPFHRWLGMFFTIEIQKI